jgi:hypothetical protein
MGIEHTLQKEIEESQRWLNIEKEDSTYKRDLAKRIEQYSKPTNCIVKRILDWILYQVCGNEVKRIGLIDKEEISYDDSLDALRLSLKECNIK